MSKINWQQPYVNIFKHFTIASDKNVTKSGDVSTQMDNQIKSLVYKISGASNTSNFISIPKLSGQSLLLTGRYVYVLFKPMPNKYFSLHIDATTVEKTTVRVSFSNSFREFKSSQTWLQFPYVIQAPNDTVFGKIEQTSKDLTGAAPPITKWTVLCVDMVSLMASYTNRTYESVRGFRLSANMMVKNVITSDYLYEPGVSCAEARAKHSARAASTSGVSAFPRELAYPCEKHDQWARLYDFVTFPAGESARRPFDSAGQSRVFVISTDKENQPRRADVRQVAPSAGAIPHSAIDTLTFKSRSMSKFGTNGNNIVLDLPLVGVPLDDDDSPTAELAHDELELDQQQDIHVYPSQNWHKSERFCDDNNGLYSSSSSSLSSLANDDLSVGSKKKTYQTCLEPDPIMKLNKIIGFSTATCKSIRWSHDSQYIIYSCQANLIAYHLNTHAQYCYVGHADSISCLAVSPDNSTIASGQSGPYSVVRLWKFDTQKCLSIFRVHDHSLYLLQYSSCGQYLCGVGRDKQSKTLLVVWDLSSFGARKKSGDNFAKVIAKAHTDVHINQIMFLNYDSTRLISCGRDNVRFWRLKNDTLRSCAVNLSPYIQALNMNSHSNGDGGPSAVGDVMKPSQRVYLEFTDLAVNARPDNNENLVYACTKAGQIFVFNSAKMEIENVRILEPIMEKSQSSHKNALKLNSLTVSDSFCVTGSDDGYVRVWPLDFSQVSVEAEHEKSIGAVRFSPDCLKIVTSTLNGNLGILNVERKEYLTLVRSHTDQIADISIDSSCKYLATCSLDSTVRVWSFTNCRQLYDFSAANERPTRLTFQTNNPATALFTCGFDSGTIRVFNVTEGKLLREIKSPHQHQHGDASFKCEITDLAYANNGKRLVSADSSRYICLFNVERDYSLIRVLPNSILASGSLTVSPDQKHLAVIGPTDRLISIYDSLTLNEALRISISCEGKSDSAVRLAYASADLNQLLCVTAANKLLKFDSNSGRLLSSISKIHRSATDYLSVSTDGRYLITAGDKCIKIWDYEMKLEKNYQTFVGHSAAVSKILLTPDLKTLISVGDSIVFWDFLAYQPQLCPSESILDTSDTICARKLEMPKGRDQALVNYNVIREIQNKNTLKPAKSNINDVNKLKILNETSFEEMRAVSKLPRSDDGNNYSFCRPRTPPVATEINIDTISADVQIDDDTFFNEDVSFSKEISKKFENLPNFVSSANKSDDDAEETASDENALLIGTKPNVVKHLNAREKESTYAKRRYTVPEDKCGIRLKSVIGYNGKHATENLIWNVEREFFAFSIGNIISVENLKSGAQTILYAHPEDVTALCIKNDFKQMASASCFLPVNVTTSTEPLNISSQMPKCQIVVWDCGTFEQVASVFHKNACNVTCLRYSFDDRYLVSISDYKCSSLVVWKTHDYTSLVFIDNFNYVINDVAWNPFRLNEFCMCGQNKSLVVCSLDEKKGPNTNASLKFNELDIPLVVCEQQSNNFEFTSIAYGEDMLLFAATNHGLITVWSFKTNKCILNWRADTSEISVLVCNKSKLITGSAQGSLKMWNISSVYAMMKRSDARGRKPDGLVIENEIELTNCAIKCCAFDQNLEIGILGTDKCTLWYVNWLEESSVRLVSSHTAKINSIKCLNDTHLSSVGDDGSLNIWSLHDRERIVQFEVKSAATCQTLLKLDDEMLFKSVCKCTKLAANSSPLIAVGYEDGSVRLYDIDQKKLVNKFNLLSHPITALEYCEKTTNLIVGSLEGHLLILDLDKGSVVKSIRDHFGAPITGLDSFHREDKQTTCWLASSRDRRVSVWTTVWAESVYQIVDWLTFPAPVAEANGQQQTSYKYWLKYPPSIGMFERGGKNKSMENLIYVGYGLNKELLVYNFVKKQIVRSMNLSEWAECVCLSPKANLLALGTKTRLVQIKDYKTSTFQDFAQHSDKVGSLCFSLDGKQLFTASFNEIFIWDVKV